MLEETLKELITLKELLKKLRKDLEVYLQSGKFEILVKEITNLSQEISELKKTLDKWVGPNETLNKIKILRKEIEETSKIIEKAALNIDVINKNLYLKPKKYSFLLLGFIFLMGMVIGYFVYKLLTPPTIVKINNIKFVSKGKCLEIGSGELILTSENKTIKVKISNKMKIKLCEEEQ